jgi:transcriptional regulator with XRE-family HTH domain
MTLQGYRVAQLREKLGYGQEDLADLINTSQKQVSKYEHDSEPGAEKLALLARALDTTTDFLVGLTDNPVRPIGNETDLSDDERHLLEIYRAKSVTKRRQAIEVLRVL